MSRSEPIDRDRAAWIGEGPEQCTYCLQGYSLEVEVHCVFCDGPGCPHCFVRVREAGLLSCPRCRDGHASTDASD